MRDYRGEGGREDKKKSGIGNVRAQKWNEGDNRERSGNQRNVSRRKAVRASRGILLALSTREIHT